MYHLFEPSLQEGRSQTYEILLREVCALKFLTELPPILTGRKTKILLFCFHCVFVLQKMYQKDRY